MGKGSNGQKALISGNSIPEAFSQQVKANPSAIALTTKDRIYTFLELDYLSNQLAHRILEFNLPRESRIAISVERSAELIIGMLAIFKSGAVYVPVDPTYPEDRIKYLLKDSDSDLLLTTKCLSDKLKDLFPGPRVIIDDYHKSESKSISPPDIILHPNDLAYSIYTSGSTGNPKGVLIEQHSLINLVNSHILFFPNPVDRFLLTYSYSFDGSVILIWWTLLSGGTLVLAPEGIERDIVKMCNYIYQKEITHLLTFPSVYQLILDHANLNQLQSLKTVCVAGEACPGKLVQSHHKKFQHTDFYNLYGPSEATVGSTLYKTRPDHDSPKTPIGEPNDGVKIYILDEHLKPVPKGTIGEICIGGKGVGRGYHNRPELTKEKFVEIAINGVKDRIYRSGDLGKVLPDGNFDFCGRKDTQVKLRGYRIELGELESVIKNIPEVRDSVVVISEGNSIEQKLIAYYQLMDEDEPVDIRKIISELLPEYMIPSIFQRVEKFKLSPSGKIDRLNLPKPSEGRPELNNLFKAATSKLEKYLVEKWEKTLGISGIGIQDKFFELGGNSLLAAGFISELQQLFNETIFIVTIFEYPTIEQYSAMLVHDYAAAVEEHFGQKDKSSQTDPKAKALVSDEIKAFLKFVPERAIPPKVTRQNSSAIFILAPPRSGTSLLRNMLSGHPEIFAANELQLLHFSDMKERATAYEGKFSLWKEGLVRAVMELHDLRVEEALSLVQRWENEKLDTSEVYKLLQEKTGGGFLLDKSPSYALDYNALLAADKIFENAKFIHLSRHPFAMIKSFDKMHMDQVMYLNENPYRGKQLAELIWYHSHKNILNFFKEISDCQKFTLHYENLVSDPNSAAENLCNFLELDFHPDIVAPYKDKEKKMMDGIYKDSKPMGDVKFLTHGKIKAELADKWKKIKDVNLSGKTQSLAEKLDYRFEELVQKNTAPSKKNIEDQDIAIIGMSLRVPGANNLDQFWSNLVNQVDVSRNFTEKELIAAGANPENLKDDTYVKKGMVLDDYDCFDEKFFGFTPKEAALMDPQHRIYLQVAYAALEDAGIIPSISNYKIGVYGGVARNTYLVNNVITHPRYFESLDDFQLGIGLEKDFPATKLAYKLNLKGPAVNMQTACSSTGVALHMACQTLRSQDADVMIVGGGRIQPPVELGYQHKDGHALSPTGYCHTFDADAKGMVRGQGMAFVVLKKLSKAIEDGDNIRAVIKGSAINNDGSDKIGFTAPSASGQTEAIIQAYKNAKVNPAEVSYIEAHGTGTTLGDPIEIAGLSNAFKNWTAKKQYCAIASVKSNVGHLDAGACVLGLIKTTLALEHELLPASMHYEKPNPQINFAESPFFVNYKLRDWKRTEAPRYAGVSALGLGGTNAHIVISEAPILQDNRSKEKQPVLITLSAKKEKALHVKRGVLKEYLESNPEVDLNDVAYTLNSKRELFMERDFIVGKDLSSIQEQLSDFALEKSSNKTHPKNFVFLFPGGGAQHQNMGRELYEVEPVFKEAVDKGLAIVEKNHGYDFTEMLYPSDHKERIVIDDPLAGITLLFIVEYATAKLWESWGVEPSAMIGHSLGEYTAATLAGVFSQEDAMKMVVARGELFKELPEGGMLSIALPPDEVRVLVGDRLDIAAINRPDHCVVSGSKSVIDIVKAELNELEIHATRPKINVAAHSREIDVILDRFHGVLKTIKFFPAQKKLISNLRGDWAAESDFSSAEYWLDHLRTTVNFSAGIERLFDPENNILLEVGPGQTLATFARQHNAKPKSQSIFASLPHPKEATSDYEFILKTVGHLWKLGAYNKWSQFYQYKQLQTLSLPTYPFAKNRHWIEPKSIVFKESSTKNQNGMGIQKSSAEQGAALGITRENLILGKLKKLFHELSGIPINEMSNQDTFLEMGFDSLFLTQAVSKIKKAFQVNISFRQLFDDLPNLGNLAKWLDEQIDPEIFKDELEQARRQSESRSTTEAAVDTSGSETQQRAVNDLLLQPINFSGLANSDIARIVEQQLNLMQQQLWLLGGAQPPQVENGGESSPEKEDKDTTSLGKAKAPVQHTIKGNLEKNKVVNSTAFRQISQASGQKAKRIIRKWEDLTERESKYLKDLIKRYTGKTYQSQLLTQSQRKHLADPRSISGFHPVWKDLIYQLAINKSKGSRIWDLDGNEYIDYRSSFGISLFGHSPEFIKKAIQDQLEKGFELGVLAPLAKEVADLICQLSQMERVTLVNTGSEALSASVRAARTYSGKQKIAVFEGDYHGIADELLVRSLNPNDPSSVAPVAPGIPPTLVSQVLVLHYDDPLVLDKIKENADELAAVLIEPIQPNRPAHQPAELIKSIRKITERHDIALIFDEMITGFRLGVRGAQEWYGVEADMAAYGKIISGGLPFAALAGKSKYLNVFDGGHWQFGDDSVPPAGVTFFGGTFVRHPLGLASALAVLKKIQEEGPSLYTTLNERSASFARQISELFLRTKVPLRVEATASIITIRPIDKNPFIPLFYKHCVLKGIHLSSKASLITTSHTDEDFEQTIASLEEAIREMQTAGFFPITVREVGEQNQVVVKSNEDSGQGSSKASIVSKDNIPLTDGQKEVWVEQQLGSEAAAAYNLAGDILLEGELDIPALERAMQKLVDRHEALRCFYNRNEPTQKILDNYLMNLKVEDLSAAAKDEQNRKLSNLRALETLEPMDLFEGPLVRIKLVKISDSEHHLLLTAHHGIADGWSSGLIARDLGMLYALETNIKKDPLPQAKQLSEFAIEQEVFKHHPDYRAAEEYWANQYKDDVPVLEFPTDRIRPATKTYEAGFEKLILKGDQIQNFRSSSAKQGATLFVSLFAAFEAFIYRISGQDDFILGMVAAAQSIAGNQNLVAHGVSLLPVRSQVNGDVPYGDHLRKSRSRLLDAFDHQSYTLGALVKKLKLKRDPSRQPMISILFNMDSELGELEFGNLSARINPIPRHFETFDVFFNVKTTKDEIHLEWTYNKDLFESETIKNRLLEFEIFLQSLIQQPELSIDEHEILPALEKEKILLDWNQTDAPYPEELCIHHLVEQTVLKNPNKIAVECNDETYTYAELNEKANRIASELLEKGIATGDLVGIYMERSVDLLVGLLGILKAGGIYVPLDPNNPIERLSVILEDAAAKFLISESTIESRLPTNEAEVIFLDKVLSGSSRGNSGNVSAPVSSKDLAYVIYTSGSTGKPKGVIIPHYAVIDHHLAMAKAIGVDFEDVILNVASVSFDPSVQDFFMPLFFGGKVVIATQEEVLDGYLLQERIAKSGITLMQATPATWNLLLSVGWTGKKDLKVKSVGEGLTPELANQLLERCYALWNAYGPSETTIYTTTKKIERERELTGGYEPVGKPLDNVKVYILDKHFKPVPIGVAGEVFVGGVGVAPNGYLKRPSLTREKFVKNPFSGDPNSKLYRTGDLAKYLVNGDIEFIGRADHQVKIRGFRIELGEIESTIKRFIGVHNVIVVVREDIKSDKRIVAYVKEKSNTKIDLVQLRKFLKGKLPDYMIPSAFVILDEFPLTATLKINRKKLPKPDYTRLTVESGFEEPRNEMEQMLRDLWVSLLNISKIGVYDNFFDLGGHSLIATKMMAEIRQKTAKRIPLASLLENPTISQLAAFISDQRKIESSISKSLVPIKPEGSKPAIYLVHGAGLHVLMFQTLAANMDQSQPIYAFQARGIHGEAKPFDRIEDMANHYIEELLKVDPDGPYALAGYSFGGLIAFEMAKQLKSRGKEVAMVGMFDTVINPSKAGEKESYYQSLKRLGKKAAWNLKTIATDPVENLKYKSWSITMRLKRLGFNRGGNQEDNPGKYAEYGGIVDQMNKIAFESYKLSPYDGKIHVFKAKNQRFWMSDFEFLGWKKFAKKGVLVHPVPGDHLNLFNSPNGEKFAKILQKVLDGVFEERKSTIQHEQNI